MRREGESEEGECCKEVKGLSLVRREATEKRGEERSDRRRLPDIKFLDASTLPNPPPKRLLLCFLPSSPPSPSWSAAPRHPPLRRPSLHHNITRPPSNV